MGSFTFQTIVLVLIGAAVFALGTINIRGHFRMKRPGVLFKGKVLNVKLLERRDKEDRLIQHYYELQVQCRTTDKTFNIWQRYLEVTSYRLGLLQGICGYAEIRYNFLCKPLYNGKVSRYRGNTVFRARNKIICGRQKMKDIDLIWPVILFLLGLFMLINPKLLWKMEHYFTAKNGEPTDLYIAFMRIGGLFFMFASVIISVACFA